MNFPRSSGLLLHPTSLPGPFGIGDLGPAAFAFADFLAKGAQSLWQVLPLGPTGYGDSPYACYSAFAGNTLLISPEQLVADGLLSSQDLSAESSVPEDRVNSERAHQIKDVLLLRAHQNFKQSTEDWWRDAFQDFTRHSGSWLNDYALFRTLKTIHDGVAWNQWTPALRDRKPAALEQVRGDLHDEIELQMFCQFLFFRQWCALKEYCNARGIKLVGDIPIFVAHDSADVWTNPEQFKLNDDGSPIVVAGVPPDYFSATGQLWGNPLYNWDQMRSEGFKWWIERIRATLQTVGILRIDHFRGFAACWEIPGGDETAERGQWVEAPGRELFSTFRETLGELPIIAEDLGVITPDVEALRDDFGFPGMRVLQFAFSSDSTSNHLPHNYHPNVVVYTGTHDNDTTVGWFSSAAGKGSTRTVAQVEAERTFCMRYLNTTGQEIHWDLIRAAFAAVANTAIVPLQDLLGLGNEARMNLPNSTEGNWSWRFQPDALTDGLAQRLRELTELYGRSKQRL